MSRHACADIWIVISTSTSARFRSLAYLGAMRSQVVASYALDQMCILQKIFAAEGHALLGCG
jgi:hypothetical protein